MKMYCKNCDNTVEVTKFTMKIVDGELIKPESICTCKTQMVDVTEYNGFGGIIKKPGGTVSKKF
jgi:hypothetical protein